MANATITNPSQGTYDLYNNDQVIRAVLNGTKWGEFQNGSKFYALMMALGAYDFTGNSQIDIVKGAGVPAKFTTAADIDTGTATSVTFANLTGVQAGDIIPGDVLKFDGEDGVLRVDSVTTTQINFTVLVTNTTGGTTADTIDSGTKGYWYSADEYDGDAPVSTNYSPDFMQNYMQMFRRSWGKGYVDQSQNTIFDNSVEYLVELGVKKMFKEIDYTLLFSEYGQAVASGQDYGLTRGLPWFLDLANAGTFTDERDQAVTNVDTGTTFTTFGLKRWASQITEGSNMKMAVMSQSCLDEITETVASLSSTVVYRKNDLDLPGFNRDGWVMDLGDYQFRVVVDRNMDQFDHVFSGAPVAGGSAARAAHKKYFLAIDPENCKIAYHVNKRLGIMAPRVVDVDNTRNLHKDEKEVKAALSLGMQNLPSHGAYGVTGS